MKDSLLTISRAVIIRRANVTTHTPYPHQKDFDKHKFQDVMSGDVLLAGTKQNDGTVKTDESLRLRDVNLPKDVMSGDVFLVGSKRNDGTVIANGDLRLTGLNLRGVIPFHMPVVLPYNGLATNAWSVVLIGINTGYPAPIFPMLWYRTNNHTSSHPCTLITTLQSLHQTLLIQYRLIAYKESNAASLSRDYHLHTNVNYTNEDRVAPAIKRSGRCFNGKPGTYLQPSFRLYWIRFGIQTD